MFFVLFFMMVLEVIFARSKFVVILIQNTQQVIVKFCVPKQKARTWRALKKQAIYSAIHTVY